MHSAATESQVHSNIWTMTSAPQVSKITCKSCMMDSLFVEEGARRAGRGVETPASARSERAVTFARWLNMVDLGRPGFQYVHWVTAERPRFRAPLICSPAALTATADAEIGTMLWSIKGRCRHRRHRPNFGQMITGSLRRVRKGIRELRNDCLPTPTVPHGTALCSGGRE